ncbi:MAG TPA: hypothetical protein VKE74_25525 [Gemmataceae bacterium]|nr:hypothetical protein [Gemmataceae bacterium]
MRPSLLTVLVAGLVVWLSPGHLRADGGQAPDPKDITEVMIERKSGPAPPAKDNVHIRREDQPAAFHRLATVLVRRGFFDLRDRYEPRPKPSDADSIVITVVYGKERKVVENYAGAGDDQVWEFEMLIRGVAADLNRFKRAKP